MEGLASPAGVLMPHEWHRAWRHEELARDERMASNHRYRRREKVKRAVGDAMLVGAVIVMFGSIVRAVA